MEDKSAAFCATEQKEKYLREEYLKIKIENDMLMTMQSQSAAMHREITQKLDNDLQSMIANHNELDHQLRDSKLTIRLEREEYKKRIDTANQLSQCGLPETL